MEINDEQVTGPSGTTQKQKEFITQRTSGNDNPLPQSMLPPQDTNVCDRPRAQRSHSRARAH